MSRNAITLYASLLFPDGIMRWLEQHWYRSNTGDRLISLLLRPLSLVFGATSLLRKAAYRRGILKVTRLPVPVIVVGNISVGGTGKTPLTIMLADRLRRQYHRQPGIICRGYRGSATEPQAVMQDSDPAIAGDEAVLLARLSGCPVWIGANRAIAARRLLDANASCDVLISDDGLQHYALARDFEIAVIDGSRGLGNGLLLPAGPLREAPERLAHVNAIVMNGNGSPAPFGSHVYRMTMCGESFANLKKPQLQVPPSYFSGRDVHAVAAIGNPQRFFAHLKDLGIAFTAHPFADHHAFTPADLAFGDTAVIIMTAKDGVKCGRFANDRHWVLQVDASLDGDITAAIMNKIGKPT